MRDDARLKSTEVAPLAPGPFAFFALIGANVALAFGPWFIRLADTGPVAAGFWRITLASPLLLVAALGSGWRPRDLTWSLSGVLVLSGIAFAADLGSWHLGILRTTLANATLFGNSATLFFPIYGFLIARTWPSRTQGLALLLALTGALLLMGRSYELNPRHLAGDTLCLLAGVLYTVYFVFMSRALVAMTPLPALALSTIASILPLLVFAILLGERIWPNNWWPLIGVALSAQIVGQGLMTYALSRFSPLIVGIALLTQLVVSGAIGWIVYDERLGMPDFIGAGLVGIALVLVRRRVADAAGKGA